MASDGRYIFNLASHLRSLIKPAPGYAVAYLDYEQQEFGIAAFLSSDTNMMNAYRSGDAYLARIAHRAFASRASRTI